jgi:hypothetical protein
MVSALLMPHQSGIVQGTIRSSVICIDSRLPHIVPLHFVSSCAVSCAASNKISFEQSENDLV